MAFVAEIQKGVGLRSLMTFSAGFNPALILIASFFNKKAYWKLDKLDYVMGGLALLGIILWQITGEGNVAIVFAILADGLAAIPTIVKAYSNPETESPKIFLLGIVNATIALLTIDTWSFAHWGFPAYIVGINMILYPLIRFKLGLVWQRKFGVSKNTKKEA